MQKKETKNPGSWTLTIRKNQSEDLNVRTKTIKLLKENICIKFGDLKLGNGFKIWHKALSIEFKKKYQNVYGTKKGPELPMWNLEKWTKVETEVSQASGK